MSSAVFESARPPGASKSQPGATLHAERSPLPVHRRAGVCMHVTSLPGPYGIGEIIDGGIDFLDSLADMAMKVWQFLPLGPTAYGDSPYQPLSTFAGNEMLIGIRPLIRLGLISDLEAELLTSLPRHTVDYGALIPRKNQLLALAADRFESHASAALKADCDDFVAEHNESWLHDYALFRILKKKHELRAWPQWDTRYVRREPAALRELEESSREEIAAIKVVQFLFNHQWQKLRAAARERGIRLFGDVPIYIALDSADAWAQPEILRIDRDGQPEKVAGVPPDYFSEDGQLWGNPLYDWDYHAATGYRWWADRIRHALGLMDLVRIDHFRGFESYWSVPAEAKSARDGRWETGPGDAIFDGLRKHLGPLPLVAEDLGDITDAVDELRSRQKIPGMNVLQFQAGEAEFDLSAIDDLSVCYTGTHDNDTLAGWFNGGPGDVRTPEEIVATQQAVLRHSGGHPSTIAHDVLRLALRSDARIAIAPMQDLLGLGSEARLNTPGTSANNWRWRLPDGLLSHDLKSAIREMVESTGRI